jgi:hypothetical protein
MHPKAQTSPLFEQPIEKVKRAWYLEVTLDT